MKKKALAIAALVTLGAVQVAEAAPARAPQPLAYYVQSAGSSDADGGFFSQTFTIETPGSFNGSVSISALASVFSGLTATLSGSSTPLSFTNDKGVWGATANLGSGSYTLTVSGTASAAKSGYLVNTNGSVLGTTITAAAPVPEPESYAMFLAGLGLMGAVARRRSRS